MNQKKMPSLGGESTHRIDRVNNYIAPLVERVRRDVSAIKLPEGSRWTREPLTDARVHEHLNGGTPRGACPIHEGQSTTRLALFDLDSHGGEVDWPAMAKTARSIADTAALLFGLNATAFRSSGGRGIHLFFIWSEPQDAHSVRRTLAEVLAACGLRDGARGVAAGEVEVFPKQDEVPVGGHGNQFILPLAGKSVPLDDAMHECSAPTWSESAPVHVVERPARVARETAGVESLPRVEAALFAIPNEHDYDGWLRMLFAVREATGGSDEGLALFTRWSAQCDRHDEAFLRREWARHDRPGVTRATLFAEAVRHGWQAGVMPSAEGFEDVPVIEVTREPMTLEHESDVATSRFLAAELARHHFRFESGGRGWMTYTKGVYRPCRKGEEQEVAKRLHLAIMRAPVRSDRDAKQKFELAKRAQSAAGIRAALSLAQSDPRLAVEPGDFDQDPTLWNCANGVLRLDTGELLPHDPARLISRQCPIAYDPHARADRFDQFLIEISNTDVNWVAGLQRAIGYSMTGRPREEVAFFLLGVGANGKSLLCNLISMIAGDYAASAPSGFLMQQRTGNADAATPTLAALPGVRFLFMNEIEAGARLSAQMLKVATSTDAIAARHLYGKLFNFRPSHVPWVRGNHRPIVADTDEGIWRRIRLVPFDRHFAPDARDPGLEKKLQVEAPGILAWMVRGCRDYLEHGLMPASRVVEATQVYRRTSDLLAEWIDEHAVTGPGLEWPQRVAYASYRGWCHDQGLQPMTKKSFTVALSERGIKSIQQPTGARLRVYEGICGQHEQHWNRV